MLNTLFIYLVKIGLILSILVLIIILIECIYEEVILKVIKYVKHVRYTRKRN